jgi:hypothetical protein
MTNNLTPQHRVLLGQVHARVGRNVIRVQSLEGGLKALVPFLDLQGATHCLDGLADRHAQVAKNTLGQLVKAFLDSSSSDDPEFAKMVEGILRDRNNLVHHFHSIFGPQLLTPEGCVQASAQLDEQFEAVRRLERLVNELLMDVLHALRDVTFNGAPEYDEFAALCRDFGSAVSAGDPLAPPREGRDGQAMSEEA